MSPAVLGFLRGVGVAVAMATLGYIGDVTHLTFISHIVIFGIPINIGAIIAAGALAIEHKMEASGQGALFGLIRYHK